MNARVAVVSPMRESGRGPGRHPPRAKATSPPSLEWKKQVDHLLGGPLVHAFRLLRAGAPPAPLPEDAGHVVLCKLWGLGNLAMVLPLVAAVRARHPRARITFLSLERNRELLASQPGLDRILTIDDHGLAAPIADLLRAVRLLRADRADLFLDFEQFLRVAGLLARAAGARCVVGFDTPGQGRKGLYDRTVPCAPDRHMSFGFAELAHAAGLPTGGLPTHGLVVPLAAQPRVAALVGDGAPRPWFVLHPGSGDNFPGRRWPVERFAAVAARLHARHGGSLFVTGGAGERPLAAELVAELAAQQVAARDFSGALDLPELLALLATTQLLLSNDTGPVHLANALRTPVVALFGPNAPQLYGPLGANQRALYHPPPCSPCLTNQNAKTSACTLPICILRIAVDEVVAAAEELLAARPAERAVATWKTLAADLSLAGALLRPPRRGRPIKVTAVLTEHCHLRCDFCRLWEAPRAGVATGRWLAFFQANPFLRWVNLTGGELFAKERLDELLDGIVAALPDLALLDFPTAGQTPDAVEASVRRLLATRLPRLAVTVSLDGGPALHDELRGVGGAFERAFETFARLRPLRSSRFTLMAGCTLTDRADEQERSLVAELARRLHDFSPRELHFNLAHQSTHYYRNLGFTGRPGAAALDVLRRAQRPAGALGWIEAQYARLAPRALAEGFPPVGCEALLRTVFVGPDLTVFPCTIWERPLGNLADFDLSLEKLLARAEVEAARAEIVAQRCPGCFSPCEAVPAMLAHPIRTALATATFAARDRSAVAANGQHEVAS